MEKRAVIIFDGTGPIDDSQYSIEYKDSFCSRLSRDIPGWVFYQRGVNGEEGILNLYRTIEPMRRDNWIIPDKVERAVSFFSRAKIQNSDIHNLSEQMKVYLIGHSRGGLCCVLMAQQLARYNWPVEAMFLFDAVDMTYKSNCDVPKKGLRMGHINERLEGSAYDLCKAVQKAYGAVIPSNVRVAYHAMRDPMFGKAHLLELKRIQKHEEAEAANWAMVGGAPLPVSTQSRDALSRLQKTRSYPGSRLYDWGNCATEVASPETNLVTKRFMASHGALGGVPWPSTIFSGDDRVSDEVESWMWANLRYHRLVN